MPQDNQRLLLSSGVGLSIGTLTTLSLLGPLSLAGLAEHNLPQVDPAIKTSQSSQQAASPTTSSQAASNTQPRFTCEWRDSQYTVVYHPSSRPQESFAWATPGILGGGWTPERRCTEIARRFEEYRPDGLVELQNSQLNNYNVVCVTTRQNPSCRLVFTVPPGQDPIATRNRVFQNVVTADSGQQTQAVNTFADSNSDRDALGELVKLGRSVFKGNRTSEQGPINLLPFLAPSDGGTGKALK